MLQKMLFEYRVPRIFLSVSEFGVPGEIYLGGWIFLLYCTTPPTTDPTSKADAAVADLQRMELASCNPHPTLDTSVFRLRPSCYATVSAPSPALAPSLRLWCGHPDGLSCGYSPAQNECTSFKINSRWRSWIESLGPFVSKTQRALALRLLAARDSAYLHNSHVGGNPTRLGTRVSRARNKYCLCGSQKRRRGPKRNGRYSKDVFSTEKSKPTWFSSQNLSVLACSYE
ncbi:hypothetical protein WG66_013913 [Moniliophthora roreri]|nr:hypothetical protein WG66_013913 [Moniliophthora roreri]